MINVLFLCTGNSARSIIAESVLNQLGEGRFQAFSAGSHPTGQVNPRVLEFLESRGFTTTGARSKSWDEFAAPGGPKMNLVITVCDGAAEEACPMWPGHPAVAHWSAPDPALHMPDPERAMQVIGDVFGAMHRRISSLVELPIEKLGTSSLQAAARKIAGTT
ncbi:MAG TPA: arsenate reductase ArsC [Casimicrobiaceae bacterium]|nr:arsenate reductase ArsC [Casimicrobiaceae bacterium]